MMQSKQRDDYRLNVEIVSMLGYLVGMLKGVAMICEDDVLKETLNKNISTVELEIDQILLKLNELAT